MLPNVLQATASSSTTSSSPSPSSSTSATASSISLRFILLVVCITLLHRISRKWEERERFYDDSDESLKGHAVKMRKEVLERFYSESSSGFGNDSDEKRNHEGFEDEGEDCDVNDSGPRLGEGKGKKARVDGGCEDKLASEEAFAISSGAEKGKGRARELEEGQGSTTSGSFRKRSAKPNHGQELSLKHKLEDLVERNGGLDLEDLGACTTDAEDPLRTPVQRKRPSELDFEEEMVKLGKSRSQVELDRWERIQLQSSPYSIYQQD
ncbi:hypothetical protein D9758_002545 [Tetrapyrgos nigripes]|uniref:Uncharacterized protein n=1 Tax=Tetrapyrgos nigripes TaxID=182062 RepID=A0A8H5LTW6_9AGAR|nr:hypothetical protein D9758_002545 [Tetrapyrgos nigripes]